ncbi:hypothetical protein BH11ACT6_BH11ACT6_09550 [soil metagenome]
MTTNWKALEVIIPDHLSASEILHYIHAQVRVIAAEAGEFVREVRVGVGTPHSDQYLKWSASYLPGLPGKFPLTS